MTQEEAKLLKEAKQFCDDNNKSTEFMLQYMSDVANVSHDTVMEYLKPTPDALAFIKGCNNSIPKLNKNVYSIIFIKFVFLFLISGNRNPNGIVIIMFKTTCLIKSPLPLEMSMKGTKFIGT